MLKIKSYLMISLLLFAMIFNFAACTNDAESSSNELAGKSFGISYGKSKFSLEFKDDTYTTYNLYNSHEFQNCMCEETETASYTADYDKGYLLAKTIKHKKSYLRNGKIIYTEPETLPDSLDDYIKEQNRYLKAVMPDIDEYEIKTRISNSLSPFSFSYDALTQDDYDQWKEYKTQYNKLNSEFYRVLFFKLEDDKLFMPEDDFAEIPEGKKLGDIFNGRFYFSKAVYNTLQSSDTSPEFYLDIQPYALMGHKPTLIYSPYGTEEKYNYQILSATNDKLQLVPCTWGSPFCSYDVNLAFDCHITYKNGKNKTTVTLNTKDWEYSFDIEYITKAMVDEVIKDGHEIMELTLN